jgi:hypothetical protein
MNQHFFVSEGRVMNAPILICSSLAIAVLILALAREIRLRRALQLLLTKILVRWRSHHKHENR